MLVSEEFARTLGEGGEVLGLSLRAHRDEDFGRTIVGVVPDLQSDGMAGPPTPAVYVPVDQSVRTTMTFLIRADGASGLVIPAIRSALAEIDPNVALAEMQTLEETRKGQLGGIRFIMAIFGGFGVMALILAVSGVYGQVAYSVTQRTQEIGVRMAIGATAGSVQGRMVAEGARLATVGLALGSVLAIGFARLLSFALFGLSWLDPRAFGSVLLTLAVAVLLASWLPARRVTRVDPVQALRAE
jgi:predicted lysophospholipase L1 biosynthesis ABC-type transport system permease subunit